MPMVMNAQTTAAKTDVMCVREGRVIFRSLLVMPNHFGYARVIAQDVPYSLKRYKSFR